MFIVQYPACVKVSTIARPSTQETKKTSEGWQGPLYDRLEQLRAEVPGLATEQKEPVSVVAGYVQ